VHHEDPGPFISYGASLGYLDDIVLENMTVQTLRRKGDWQEDGPPAITEEPKTFEAPGSMLDCPGVVAVASGDGLRQVFESLGVCAVVVGGQTMNPSTEDLLQAAEGLPHENIIILPNNKNIILAARQAAELADKHLHVIETRSVPEGIAAMLGFNNDANVEQNIRSMIAAYQDISTAEVTRAVRDVALNGIEVKEGDLIGMINGQLRCRGDDLAKLVEQILELIDPDEETEVFTLYYGEPVQTEEAELLLERLMPAFPQHDIELLSGGQPHYHYLISAE
jgi:dihydroxyacetone kinase-like predicted kinase